MGMGSGSIEVAEVAEEVLKSGKVKKAVLDAEAITKNIPEDVECILTPHRGEFRRVFGIEEKSGWEESVRRAAEEYGATILLKSREDIISDGKRIRINKSGNPGMTVGGTGDVLAGITGAFFALNDAFWSASSAAFINGLSGDLCLEEKGFNFTAMDVVEKIPYAIKKALEFGK
jgi:NAD(P)H-hydrate epimerase